MSVSHSSNFYVNDTGTRNTIVSWYISLVSLGNGVYKVP